MEINAWVWPHPLRITFCFQSMLLKYGKIYILHILICPITCVACKKKLHCSLLYSKPKFPDSSFPKVCLWIGYIYAVYFFQMIRSLEVAAFFFLGYLKLKGGRHSKCCEEQCGEEEKGRWGGKMLHVLLVEAELAGRDGGTVLLGSALQEGVCAEDVGRMF